MRHARALLLLAVVLAPACQSQNSTKIVVVVGSDIPVPTGMDSVRIEVTGPSGPTAAASKTFLLAASSESGKTVLPIQLEVVPPGSANTTFTVTATGLLGPNAIVSQTARVSFVAGQSLLLTLFLGRDCQGVVCNNVDYTCAAGACTQPIVVTNLPPYVPNQPFATVDGSAAIHDIGGAFDNGGTMDSGTREAGSTSLYTGDGAPVDTESDQPQDVHLSTGGTGGTPGSGGVGGTGGAASSDARAMDSGSLDTKLPDAGPIDGFAADALDAPISGAGGGGGASGSGGASGGVVGSGGTVATGGAIASGGAVGTGGGLGTGGTTMVCQGSATQCSASGSSVQTCTNGQWGAAVACGPRQTCTGPVGTGKCTCNVDPVCTSVGNTCANASVLAACSQDEQACLYESSATTCMNGAACSGVPGSAGCCANAVGTTCLSSASLQTCTAVANGCPTCTTLTCANGCSGAPGSAGCCANAVGTTCLLSTSLQTCTAVANGCPTCTTLTCANGCSGATGSASCTPPSCSGLATTCGPSGNDDCCKSLLVSGGTYYRSCDGVDFTDESYPATVASFYLDKYEITVGRFRQFVNAGMGTQANPPAAGAGTHPRIAGSVWDTTWTTTLAADTASLKAAVKCNAGYQTWTDTAGSNESRPMNCLDWYTAFAFCAWDGGRLPTEAEWNYAASGGNEQRYYPWSSPGTSTTIDGTYAVYNGSSTQNVGSKSPKGDGKWDHSDLAGNVWEWNLDWYASPYTDPCNNCADLTSASGRVIRGGSFVSGASGLRSAYRYSYFLPGYRGYYVGARCARTGP